MILCEFTGTRRHPAEVGESFATLLEVTDQGIVIFTAEQEHAEARALYNTAWVWVSNCNQALNQVNAIPILLQKHRSSFR